MKTSVITAICFCAMAIGTIACKNSSSESTSSSTATTEIPKGDSDNAGITLPSGFSAIKVAIILAIPGTCW